MLRSSPTCKKASIVGHVASIAAADIEQHGTVGERVDKLGDARPRLVARGRKVRRNGVVDVGDVPPLDGGLLVAQRGALALNLGELRRAIGDEWAGTNRIGAHVSKRERHASLTLQHAAIDDVGGAIAAMLCHHS
jgi:hypothetical protein